MAVAVVVPAATPGVPRPWQPRGRLIRWEYEACHPREDVRWAPRFYAGVVNALTTWWRRWRDSPARDIVTGLAVAVVLLAGSYGEAHPNQPGDIRVNGHPVPHTPS